MSKSRCNNKTFIIIDELFIVHVSIWIQQARNKHESK